MIFFINLIFFIYIKIDLTLFYEPNQFFLFHKTNLNFSKKRGHIHKVNLFELILVMYVQHIIQHHAKKGILVIRV